MKIACVIIDNRKLFYLNNVFKNFFHYLEEDKAEGFNFDFILYTDEFKPIFLEEEVLKNINIIKDFLPDFYLNSLTHSNYSWFLTHPSFWSEFLSYDRVLIFQHDSILTRHRLFSDNWEFIKTQEFIGAPATHEAQENLSSHPEIARIFNLDLLNPLVNIQNGGLSIRDPKRMHKICLNPESSMIEYDSLFGEDVFFAKQCQLVPHSIFLEYYQYRNKSLYTEKAYGLHLNLHNLRLKNSLLDDLEELKRVKWANHLFSQEFIKLNHLDNKNPNFLRDLYLELHTLELYENSLCHHR